MVYERIMAGGITGSNHGQQKTMEVIAALFTTAVMAKMAKRVVAGRRRRDMRSCVK